MCRLRDSVAGNSNCFTLGYVTGSLNPEREFCEKKQKPEGTTKNSQVLCAFCVVDDRNSAARGCTLVLHIENISESLR